jgi:hypothetical protein
MYCSRHPDRPAAGVCVECSKAVCVECKVEFDGKIYCNSCVERWVGSEASAAYATPIVPFGNTSGLGSKAAVPTALGDWNWGGFLLTWIWGIGNNVWWSFLVFVPLLGLMVMPWVLAFKGNEWAWRSRRWDNIDHFKRVQHTWAVWGWAVSIASAVLLVLSMLAAVGMLLWWLQQSGTRWY